MDLMPVAKEPARIAEARIARRLEFEELRPVEGAERADLVAERVAHLHQLTDDG
jgi:hypothetical protein